MRESRDVVNPGVVIFGMHRSGTSLLASLIEQLGLWPGAPEDLMAPKPDNPAGFWERDDLRSVNDRVLASCGETWEGPAVSEPPVVDHGLFGAALEDLEGVLQVLGGRPWFVKDPRFMLTWPKLRGAFGPTIKVLIYRHPLEVARSLRRRNGFPLMLGVALWEAYHVRASEFLAEDDPLLVSYAELCRCPGPAIDAIRERISTAIPDVRGIDVGSLVPMVRAPAATPEGDWSAYARETRASLWAELQAGHLPRALSLSPDSCDVLEIPRHAWRRVAELEEQLRESQRHRHDLWLEKNRYLAMLSKRSKPIE